MTEVRDMSPQEVQRHQGEFHVPHIPNEDLVLEPIGANRVGGIPFLGARVAKYRSDASESRIVAPWRTTSGLLGLDQYTASDAARPRNAP